jgi:hypothetical protein
MLSQRIGCVTYVVPSTPRESTYSTQWRPHRLIMSWQNISDDHNSFLHELNSPTLSTFTHGLRQPLGDSRTQTQDTSGLEMFLPSPGVSHLVDIQHAFSGGDSSLNPGSGCTFNSTTLPYGSNSTENFDFNFSFDPNLLNFDQNNGGGSHGLMLPDIPNSPLPLPPTVTSLA